MRYFCILVFTILTALSCDICAQTDSALTADTAKYIALNVYSNTDGAEVLLDSSRIGFTPVNDARVKPGNYLLKLINPGRPGEWQNENLEIPVILNADTTVTANFSYYYDFRSDPSNAGVYKNDTVLGFTPLRYKADRLLTGLLLFKRENYRDHFFDMNDYDPVDGALVKLKLKDNSKPEQYVLINKGTQFKTTRNLPAILGLATASLAAGYFAFDFKTKANSSYDQYTISGNKEKLDDSRKYDKYFAAGLVLMQAAIAGLVYFLFFD